MSPIAATLECARPEIARQCREHGLVPAHLPLREVVHEPSCSCPNCSGEMRKLGDDVTESLDRRHFEMIQHVRPALSGSQQDGLRSSLVEKLQQQKPYSVPEPHGFSKTI